MKYSFGASFHQVVLEADEKAWCTLTAEANNKVLGKRLGKELAVVKKALAKLDTDALWPLLEVSGDRGLMLALRRPLCNRRQCRGVNEEAPTYRPS